MINFNSYYISNIYLLDKEKVFSILSNLQISLFRLDRPKVPENSGPYEIWHDGTLNTHNQRICYVFQWGTLQNFLGPLEIHMKALDPQQKNVYECPVVSITWMVNMCDSLQWHNPGISTHQQLDSLFNILLSLTTKKPSLHFWPFCEENPLVTNGYKGPSNTGSVSQS